MIHGNGTMAERSVFAGHLRPDEIDSAAGLIATAYTHDAELPPADDVVQTIALTRIAQTVVEHAAAHGTVLRPTAPPLRGLAVAVWLPVEAQLPELDSDLVAACGPYMRQFVAHQSRLTAQYGDDRYDVLWFTAVHPTVRRRRIAQSLLQHRHRVLASQNRQMFTLAPTVQARTLLSTVGFRDHLPDSPEGRVAVPPFPMRWGHRPAWTSLINKAYGAAALVAGATR